MIYDQRLEDAVRHVLANVCEEIYELHVLALLESVSADVYLTAVCQTIRKELLSRINAEPSTLDDLI